MEIKQVNETRIVVELNEVEAHVVAWYLRDAESRYRALGTNGSRLLFQLLDAGIDGNKAYQPLY